MTPAEKAAIGLDEGLIRLCFGMEDVEDLKRDLLQALQSIDRATETRSSAEGGRGNELRAREASGVRK